MSLSVSRPAAAFNWRTPPAVTPFPLMARLVRFGMVAMARSPSSVNPFPCRLRVVNDAHFDNASSPASVMSSELIDSVARRGMCASDLTLRPRCGAGRSRC